MAELSTDFYSAEGKTLQVVSKDSNSQTCPFQKQDLAEGGSATPMCTDRVKQNTSKSRSWFMLLNRDE